MPAQVVSQATTVAYISSFAISKPETHNQLYQRYGLAQGFYDILRTLGYKREVARNEVSHFEQGWIHDYFKVKANVTDPGAGNSVNITLSTDSVGTNNTFQPRLYDQILFKNEVVGQITVVDTSTPSAPVVTVEPVDSSDNIGALTAGDAVTITSNIWDESTSQPDGLISKEDEYKFNVQRIKHTAVMSGDALTDQVWFETLSESGQVVNTKAKLTEIEADYQMKIFIEHAMLTGKKVTNTAVKGEAMTGLFPWVRAGGNISNIPAGLFNMVYWDTIENNLDQAMAPDEMFVQAGTARYQEIQNTLKDYFGDGVIYANFGAGNGKTSQDLHLDFSSFSKGGRTYHLMKNKMLNHPKILGAPGFDFTNKAIFTPINLVKDAKTREKLPCIQYIYKAKNGYSREMEVWPTGAAGGDFQYTSQKDEKQINYRAHVGLELFGSNRFYLIES